MKTNQTIDEKIGRLNLKNEALRIVLAGVAAKAGVSAAELIGLLELAEKEIRQLDENAVIN